MRRMGDVVTTRGRAFASAGLTLVLCGYILGFRDITRVGILLLALPLVAVVLVRRRPPGLLVWRSTDPARVSAGDVARVTTSVGNSGRRSTPLMLAEERLAVALGDRPRVLLGSLAAGERRALAYAVRPPVRGRHLLGPLAVQLRDPFGLTHRFVEVGEPTELLVLPQVHSLGGRRPPGTGVGAEGEIPFMVALHGEDDQSIREYRDGDDLRRIHWPATARTGDLMVRQEDRPARRRAVILLDPRADAHAGVGAHGSFEWAVSATASVVVHLAGLGYAIHLLTPETVQDGQDDLSTEVGQALAVLAVTQTGTGVDLARLTRSGLGLLAGGGLLVAVLAAYDERALRSVAALRRPGQTALGIVVDPASFAAHRRHGEPADARSIDGPTATDLLRGAGWRATGVGPTDAVADAWAQIGSGSAVRIGTGGAG